MVDNKDIEKRTNILFNRVIKDNFSGATSLYTNFINDDIDLIRKAKEKGIEIIHEVIITPTSGMVMHEEYKSKEKRFFYQFQATAADKTA